jgi:CheY-like chemotaxis protein
MKMPGFSGERLYDFIKATDPELAKRIVFVTGDTVNPETQNFLQSTGNLYIGKPFRVEEARRIILKSLSCSG